MKTIRKKPSRTSANRNSRLWKSLLPAGVAGGATWLLLIFLVPSTAADLPALPDLQSSNPALVRLLRSADTDARTHPPTAAAVGRLGMVYHANQLYNQAEKVYSIALESAPDDFRWSYCMALIKEETGLEKEVPAWLQKTAALNPRYYPAFQKLADIHFKQDRLEEAEFHYRKSADTGGVHSECQAISGLSRVAAKRKNWSQAINYLAPLAKEYPHLRTLHQWLQEAYSARGETAKAEEEAQALLGPTLIVLPTVRDPLGEELLRLSCSATRLLKEAGLKSRFRKPEEAIEVARRAVEVEPADADAHHFLGRTLLDARGADPAAVDEALSHLRQGLRLRPEDLLPLWYFGTFFLEQDKTDTAVEQLRTLLSAHADRTESHYYLGLVAERQGLWEEALARYQEALRHDPENAEAHHKLGLQMVRRERMGEAIRYFERAVRIKPMFTLARCNLAIALSRQGKTGLAITQFEEALRGKPNDAIAHQYLAIALLQSGKVDPALVHFREAVRFAPVDAEAHYGLGCALTMKKETSAAEEAFRQVLTLQPNHEEARQRLRELRP